MAPLPALPIRPYLPSNVKCLVADDARLNRMLIEHALTKRCGEGWTVDNTDSGEETLEAVRRQAYDLIIIDEIFSSDVTKMRGSTVVRLIRELEISEGRTRCVVVSCSGNAALFRSDIIACGADEVCMCMCMCM